MIKQILKVVNVLKIALLHTNIIPAIKYVGRIVVIVLMISMLISMILVHIQLMNVLLVAQINVIISMKMILKIKFVWTSVIVISI